jgi:hypothetical protein
MRPCSESSALVREQLDDDDGAREGERHGDVERLHHALAHERDEREAHEDGEGELAEAGGERHRADMAHVMQVELEADDEQQHRDADLRQQVDLVVGLHQAEAGGPHGDTDHDVGDQHRLAQAHGDRAGEGRDDEQQRELAERGGHRASLPLRPLQP